MTLKEQILQANDLRLMEVDVPEWQCKVWLRSWSAGERGRVYSAYKKHQAGDNLGELLGCVLANTLCDQSGKLVFTGPEDYIDLANKSGEVCERLFLAAQQHNGMGQEAIDAAKKNSTETAS